MNFASGKISFRNPIRDQPVSLMSMRFRCRVSIRSNTLRTCFFTLGVTSDATRSRPGSANP